MGKNFHGGGGRGRGRGTNRGANRKSKGDRDDRDAPSQADWMDPDQMKNPRFEAYYRGQRLFGSSEEGQGESEVSEEAEWEQFWSSLKKPLPTTFRITNGRPFTSQVRSALQDDLIPHLSHVEFEGESIPPPEPMTWYPDSLAWSFDVRRQVVRKEPHLKAFQGWLVHETETGSISRQEAVSMIPPLFLNAQHDHLTLDMCAAPGSKTAQLLEAVHAPLLDTEGQIPSSLEGGMEPAPAGIVIANDSDYKRSILLKHQASRFASPNLMVTNSDARFFPDLQVAYNPAGTEKVTTESIRYDRILCDVPCSGDGTVRKNVMIWRDWTFANGNGLHKMQLQILLRGLTLLAPGGRLVYSTCSLNPIENEAVVAQGLRDAKQQGLEVELVDTRAEPEFAPFGSLSRYPGKTDWQVCPLKNISALRQARRKHARDMESAKQANDSKTGPSSAEATPAVASSSANVDDDQAAVVNADADQDDTENQAEAAVQQDQTGQTEEQSASSQGGSKMPWVASWQDLYNEFPEEARKTPTSFWPQGDEEGLGIPRCMRVYPHLQNTGGFFVAVFRKAGEHQSMAPGIVRGQTLLDEQTEKREQEEALTDKNKAEDLNASATEKHALSPEENEEPATKRARLATQVDVQKPQDSDRDGESPEGGKPDSETKTSASQQQAWLKERTEQRSVLGIRGDPSRLKEDPFTYLDPSQEDVAALQQTYQFPRTWARNFLVRNVDARPVRNIYFSTPVVRAVVTGGSQGPYPPEETRHRWPQSVKMRLIFTGNRLFVRQGAGTNTSASAATNRSPLERWRITEDGEALIRPYLASERVVSNLELKDLAYLVRSSFALVENIPPELKLRQVAQEMSIGSHILTFAPERGMIVLPPLSPSPASSFKDKNQDAQEDQNKREHEGPKEMEAKEDPKGHEVPSCPNTLPGGESASTESTKPESGPILSSQPMEVQARLDGTFTVPIWRAPSSIVLMLDKKTKSAVSFRLFGSDLSSPTGERFAGQQKKQRSSKAQGKNEEKDKKSEEINQKSLEDDEDAAFNS